ncbi:mCG113580, partial [Mus musculus]
TLTRPLSSLIAAPPCLSTAAGYTQVSVRWLVDLEVPPGRRLRRAIHPCCMTSSPRERRKVLVLLGSFWG